MAQALVELFRDSEYKLTQFSDSQIATLEKSISYKESRGKTAPYVKCLVRDKEIKLTPEEAVRQLYILVLTQNYGYPAERMALEHPVNFGRETKRADIVIFDKQDTRAVNIIVEVKKPKLKDGKEQLKSYCNATGATIGIWSNGDSISYYHRKDPNYFEDMQREKIGRKQAEASAAQSELRASVERERANKIAELKEVAGTCNLSRSIDSGYNSEADQLRRFASSDACTKAQLLAVELGLDPTKVINPIPVARQPARITCNTFGDTTTCNGW